VKSVERFVLRGLLTVAFSVALYWGYTTLMTQRVTHAMSTIQASATQSMANLQAQQALRAREAQERAAAARDEAATLARAEAEAAQQLREHERLKVEAWARYYVAPAACEKPPSWDFQVECGNRYIRAKRAFEAEWAARNGSSPAP
jgi:hypothetical protein